MLNNLLCLCASCHFESHRNPLLFSDRVRVILGAHNYQELVNQHNAIKRWTIPEMEELLKTLKDLGG